MKTLIIFNNSDTLNYFIVDGDFSRFNNIILKDFISSKIDKECNDFLWNDSGCLNHSMNNDISIIENKQWDKVALITYLNG